MSGIGLPPLVKGRVQYDLDALLWDELICKHCTENSKYLFPEMKVRGLVPYFYIHVSVINLCIPAIGLQQTDRGNI